MRAAAKRKEMEETPSLAATTAAAAEGIPKLVPTKKPYRKAATRSEKGSSIQSIETKKAVDDDSNNDEHSESTTTDVHDALNEFNKGSIKDLSSVDKSSIGVEQKQVMQSSQLAKVVENENYEEEEKGFVREIAKPQEIFDCKYQPESISFRDKEKKEIESFLSRCVKSQQKCKCLLISGMPGCGKTLTTVSVLEAQVKAQSIDLLKFNAMNFSTQMSFILHLYMKLFREIPSNPVDQLVDACKKAAQSRTKPLVLFIDEFDNLFQQKSKEIFILFDLANNPDCKIVLLGVSNSMEMLFELSKKHHVALHEIKNIVYEPYSQKEIYSIIVSRLAEMKRKLSIDTDAAIIDDRALRLCSGRMYNLKGGDIRCLFDVCKKALEKPASSSSTSESIEEGSASSISTPSVSLPELNAIIDKLYRVDYSFISGMPTEQQLVLLAIYEVLQKDDSLVEISLLLIKKQFESICERMSLDIDSRKTGEILESLQSYQILQIRRKEGGMQGPGSMVRKQMSKTIDATNVFLKITCSDILDALKSNPRYKGVVFANRDDNDDE